MFPPLRQILPRLSDGRPAALNFLTNHGGLILCALFLLAGLALAGDYGFNYDDPLQRQIAVANLDYILGRADGVETTYYQDRVYSAVIELPLLLAERALGLEDYYRIHRLRLTVIHLFFILGGFFCYRLAVHLFGNRLIALLTLLLFLLHPRIYAHSYLNGKDLPFLSMFIIALYLLERAFRRDTLGAFVLLGIGAGLLVNLRIMGIMLLAAPLVMRGLDWFYAGKGPERKHILLTGGVFILAGGLTVYALSPYAWTNPLDYLAINLNLTVNLPYVWPQLFQGKLIPSDELPPHYIPTWVGITTPPLLMLLGFIGAAALLAQALARPGAALRNTPLRFRLLLPAAFLLPPLAVALLGSTQYEGWRHLYFIHAPLGLLAALGAGWLAVALARQRRGPVGVYALTGLGLGLILLQMTQLHPLQYVYFNFLADRTTPEHLRGHYVMDHWQLAYRAALASLLERHPGETLTVRVAPRHTRTLPPAARQRLRFAGGDRRADYELIPFDPGKPDLAFNSAYRRFYNNTLVAVRPMAATRMTPAAVAAYREIYRQAVAGEPIIRADYNVYRNGQRFVFGQENCPADGPEVWFGANLFPPDLETVPPPLRGSRPYVTFSNHRVRLDGLCLAVIQLPDYARGDLILSQRNLGKGGTGDEPLWAELYNLSRPGLAELSDRGRRNRPPAAGPAAFTVFLDLAEGRNRLIYAKPHCSPAEYETPVTLHIAPENLADLPFYLWQGGLDNRDFRLPLYGGRPGGECIAVFPLPEYPIAAIHTGQADRWEINFYPPTEPDRLRATYAAWSDRQPNIRAAFDLYLGDNRLIYLRETCAAADTAAGFFLHIIPADIADLPPERQAAGFANLDFAFDRRGGHFDGKCLAAVALPNYPVKAIRTGQHSPGQGELWAAELAVAP